MRPLQTDGASAPSPGAPAQAGPVSETPPGKVALLDYTYLDSDNALSAIGDGLRKPWKNLQARCLLAGVSAELIDDDAGRPMLVVTCGALTRSFTIVAEAGAWLQRTGWSAS